MYHFQIVTKIVRCSISDRNDCEQEIKLILPDACAMRDNFKILADIVLGPMMAHEPKIDCENETQWKGTYFIRNYTLDLQAAKILPIGGFLWRMTDIRSFREGENLLCINIDIIVRKASSRRRGK
jgi:hypothetical protein